MNRTTTLYLFTTFLSAFLLFAVQPLIAKYILPWFGGTPAVWTTCMLFFQVLLLGGYTYAHLLGTRLGPRGQSRAHTTLLCASLGVLAALAFVWDSPLTPGASWKPGTADDPIGRIVGLLAASVGLPYFVLATTGPLLQAWFGRTHRGRSPYRLYAMSNVGSLLALVTYPFVAEPWLPLRAQARVWVWGYVAFALACAGCAAVSRHAVAEPDRPVADDAPRATRGDRLLWLGLAACASTMLLATTNQLCQDVAVVPFLWVLPLALYLLSFILCFDDPRWYSRRWWHPAFGAALLGGCVALNMGAVVGMGAQIATYCLVLFIVCMVCHGELVRMRPGTAELTSFYLSVAAGGALGGLFVALAAPTLFPAFWEYHVGLWASAALVLLLLRRDRCSWLHAPAPWVPGALILAAALLPEFSAAARGEGTFATRWLYHVLVVAAALPLLRALVGQRAASSGPPPVRWAQACCAGWLILLAAALVGNAHGQVKGALARSRNFYGVLTVLPRQEADAEWRAYLLRHGRIVHGFQFLDPAKHALPTAYFTTGSGIGLAIRNHPRRVRGTPLRIGVVGLGIGTIAAYGAPGDYVRFYEINPEVLRLASDVRHFSYLRDSAARVEVVLGDARLSMERELERGEPQQFDILVLDAFSGDAIPVHLLTAEVFQIYLRHLRDPDGLLALHISNGHLDLRPVVFRLAEHFGLSAAHVHTRADDHVTNECDWVLAARDGSVLRTAEVAKAATPRDQDPPAGPLWTDDYSNLFRLLRD